jgi:hypothetical protein
VGGHGDEYPGDLEHLLYGSVAAGEMRWKSARKIVAELREC